MRAVSENVVGVAKNVLGGDLENCSRDPLTGFLRDGCCNTGPGDMGLHLVCAQMTAEFLRFSKARGNDLSTPNPAYRFQGLKPGDRWCLCAARWVEALRAGCAPKIVLAATHIGMLEHATMAEMEANSVERGT